MAVKESETGAEKCQKSGAKGKLDICRVFCGEKCFALSFFFFVCPLLLPLQWIGATAVPSNKVTFQGIGMKREQWKSPLQQLYNCCGRLVGWLLAVVACLLANTFISYGTSVQHSPPPLFSVWFSLNFLPVSRCSFVLSLSNLRDLSPELCFCPPPSCVCRPPFSTALLPLNTVATPAPPPHPCMTSWKTVTFRYWWSKLGFFHINISDRFLPLHFSSSVPGLSQDLQRKRQGNESWLPPLAWLQALYLPEKHNATMNHTLTGPTGGPPPYHYHHSPSTTYPTGQMVKLTATPHWGNSCHIVAIY